MFIDSVNLRLSSGHGGAGASSFRREKHVIFGGPDGGDGGDGGSVYFIVDNNSHTLAAFKGKKYLKAKNGESGGGKRMNGKRGENLEIVVPPGTAIYDADTGDLLLDLLENNKRVLFLQGGKGGLGNVHFKSSSNQAPQYAQKGLEGQTRNVRLELKLIADVGLVGFPNVGKSTLISRVSNARPQIANYEFTTLTPKLGLVELDDFKGFVMADIPGIIEGASDGKGLGLKFLKHIQRTKIVLFVVDLTNYRSPYDQYIVLKNELNKFSTELSKRAFAIVLSKFDACENQDLISDFLNKLNIKNNSFFFKQEIDNFDINLPFFIMPISSSSGENISSLIKNLSELLDL